MAISPLNHQTQNPSLPFILDDHFESLRAELLIYREEGKQHGLLAESEVPKDLLPMSGYGKSQYADGKDFETSRTMEDPLYLYAQSGVSQAPLQNSHAPYMRNDQVTYGAGGLFHGRPPMEEISNAYTSLRNQQMPQIASWGPKKGPSGTEAQDEVGNVVAGPPVGNFTYTDEISKSVQGSPATSRKRKISTEMDSSVAISKRFSPQGQGGSGDGFKRQPYSYDSTPEYLSLDGTHLGPPTTYQSPIMNHSSLVPSSLSTRGPSPQTSAMNQNHVSHATKSPNIPPATSNQGLVVGASPTAGNPPLVRTSSLQQGSPSPATTPTGVPPTSQFNPYTIYPHKASLKIKGNLDDMTTGWSADEQEVQRRLVQFYRTQEGSTIHATFKAVSPQERQPNTICISCIWWEAKGECYVTSVDTIALLEALVAVRFTVEEKNRIRRNLEGFRPLTVSKGKSDSEDFFKLIMGFPSPKPRNIEKDVKAFPWKTLDHALKKIISKYSASYSSTAGTLSSAGVTNYRTGYHTDMQQDSFHPTSPYEVSESGMTPYSHVSSIQTANMSAVAANSRIPMPYTTEGWIGVGSTHTPDYPLYSYPTAQNTSLIPKMAGNEHNQSPAQPHRPAWNDFGSGYIDHPTTSVSDAALYAMPAGQEPGHYSISHASSSA